MNVFFEHVVTYVVDVTGHGFDSTLLSTFVKDTIDNYFATVHKEGELVTPDRILAYLKNIFLKENYPGDYFVAMFIGVFDLQLKEFIYSSAGLQYPPLLVNLKNGDTILIYTDGIAEQKNPQGEEYFTKFVDLIENNHYLELEELKESIINDFNRFIKGKDLDDDVTLLLSKLHI